MKIMMPDKLIRTSAYFMRPYCRYVVSDYEAEELVMKASNTSWRVSSFNSYERRYAGQDLNGKKLCVFRHNAFGDQLIVSAVPFYLKHQFPEAKIHLYAHPGVWELWEGNPYVEGSAIPIPIPLDVIDQYDYHAMFEGMLEGNSEPDQSNCYDDMFRFIGCEPPDSFKRPFITPRPEDECELWGVNKPKRPYLVYHVSPANRNRCYPETLASDFLHRVLKETDLDIVLVGKDSEHMKADLKALWSHLPMIPRILDLYGKLKSFRNLVPIVQHASVVVCPDSSVMHLAAAFSVPTVSLWGLFHPQDRVAYYQNHHAMVAFSACPHAPCRDHNFRLPVEWCKDANVKTPGYCAALASIPPKAIVRKVLGVLS